jgi:hypothetical protein
MAARVPRGLGARREEKINASVFSLSLLTLALIFVDQRLRNSCSLKQDLARMLNVPSWADHPNITRLEWFNISNQKNVAGWVPESSGRERGKKERECFALALHSRSVFCRPRGASFVLAESWSSNASKTDWVIKAGESVILTEIHWPAKLELIRW